MRRKLLIAGSVLAALALAIGIAQTTGSDDEPTSELVAPEQARALLSGAPAPLAQVHAQAGAVLGGGRAAYERRIRELRGLPVVVNKWGSWCNPCRAEFPVFNRVSAKLGKRVAFLGVDSADNRKAAREFLARYPVYYPSYEDPSGALATRLGGQYFPSTIFYDRKGRQTLHQGPYSSDDELIADIERYALSG